MSRGKEVIGSNRLPIKEWNFVAAALELVEAKISKMLRAESTV